MASPAFQAIARSRLRMRPPGIGLCVAVGVGVIAWTPLCAEEGYARLEGHGGPVRGIAVSASGERALTASFDNSVGLWDLRGSREPVWLEAHEAAVNAVAFLPDGKRVVSAGDDFDIVVWDASSGAVLLRLEGHQGKILDIAVTARGDLLASAGWDGAIGLWDMADGALKGFLTGHRGPVQAVRFSDDGSTLFSASSDGQVRRWNVAARAFERIEASHGFGVNRLVLDQDAGWLAYGALDGGVRILDLDTGAEIADVTSGRRPVLGLTLSPDGGKLAIADGEGFIHLVSTEDWSTIRDFRAVPSGPVWALAFDGPGQRVLAGTIQDHVDIWPIANPGGVAESDGPLRGFHRDPATMSNGERQFARKCSICHTLTPDGGRRAGPSLHAIFGRRAGTLEGYTYSDALDATDLVWDEASLDKLFDLGPEHYTPGSKMPMQRIVRAEDRADLIDYLKTATRPMAPEAETGK